MPGIVVFKTVAAALRAGYEIYDWSRRPILARTRTSKGWAMAVVEIS